MKDGIPCTKQLIDAFEKTGSSVIAIQEVEEKDISKYGIVKGKDQGEDLLLLEDIIEKPKPELAPSRFGAIGRYVLTPTIFSCIQHTAPGISGEIQLADGIRNLMKKENVYAYRYSGRRFDTGDKMGYIQTIITYAMDDETMQSELKAYLKRIGTS
jgi:UTP--glucose-1-phosphate uridylyltransferase